MMVQSRHGQETKAAEEDPFWLKYVRFDEFIALVEAFGFTQDRISGSHHIFSHPAVPQTISIQSRKNGQAKPYQITQFTKLIEKYRLALETEDEQEEEDNAQ